MEVWLCCADEFELLSRSHDGFVAVVLAAMILTSVEVTCEGICDFSILHSMLASLTTPALQTFE